MVGEPGDAHPGQTHGGVDSRSFAEYDKIMRVKTGVSIVRALVAGAIWTLFIGEIVLFFLWFTFYPYSSIRTAGIILGAFLGGLTLLKPHLVVKWRVGSNKSETVVRMESLLYLASVLFLILGGRVHPKYALYTILWLLAVQWMITIFIRRRNRTPWRFIGGIVYMLIITCFVIADLFFPHFCQIEDELWLIIAPVLGLIVALITMKPGQSVHERAPGERILTTPLGLPTDVSNPHRHRDRH